MRLRYNRNDKENGLEFLQNPSTLEPEAKLPLAKRVSNG